ncbi:MAG TPA: hypothetical protein VNM47_04085 [Terriglobia bacterium]|nr:hypothetical protein [Terriglobia bacterium]
MGELPRILRRRRLIDRAIIICVGASWLWKIGEYIGRAMGVLRRNLGWGFVVDMTIPAALTVAAGLYFIIRRVAWRQPSVKNGHRRSSSD